MYIHKYKLNLQQIQRQTLFQYTRSIVRRSLSFRGDRGIRGSLGFSWSSRKYINTKFSELNKPERVEVGQAHWSTGLLKRHMWEQCSVLSMDTPLRVGREPDDPQHHASRCPSVHLCLFRRSRVDGHFNFRVRIIWPDGFHVQLESLQGGERSNNLI